MGDIMKTESIYRIYLSHIIRGKAGEDATEEEIEKNLEIARIVGEQLKAYFIDWEKMDGFPKIYLYVPGEHDEFVQIAYKQGYLTETEVLTTDCQIISRCQLVIMYGNYHSKGMRVEGEFAAKEGIPIYQMPIFNNITVEALKFCIHLLLTSEGD